MRAAGTVCPSTSSRHGRTATAADYVLPSGNAAFAVRRCDTFPGLGDDWVRIAVRDPATTDDLIAALRAIRVGEVSAAMTFHANLDVRGRRVVCADGRAEALPSLSALLAAGAHVDVIAPEVATSVLDLAQRGLLRWARRRDPALRPGAGRPGDLCRVPDRRTRAGRRPPAGRQPDPGRRADPGGRSLARAARPGDAGRRRTGRSRPAHRRRARPRSPRQTSLVVDRLAPLAVLAEARPDAQIIDVAKIPRGRTHRRSRSTTCWWRTPGPAGLVVRLKGGDNFVFGRGRRGVAGLRGGRRTRSRSSPG